MDNNYFKNDSKPVFDERKPFIKEKKENKLDQSSEKIYKNFVSKTLRTSENISFFLFYIEYVQNYRNLDYQINNASNKASPYFLLFALAFHCVGFIFI